jgi:predicted RNA binding protein YcfA (HicA-like mRNA interferase family)
MPKLPRISSKEAIRSLERLGFEQVRQTGSHVVMKKETQDGEMCIRSSEVNSGIVIPRRLGCGT